MQIIISATYYCASSMCCSWFQINWPRQEESGHEKPGSTSEITVHMIIIQTLVTGSTALTQTKVEAGNSMIFSYPFTWSWKSPALERWSECQPCVQHSPTMWKQQALRPPFHLTADPIGTSGSANCSSNCKKQSQGEFWFYCPDS